METVIKIFLKKKRKGCLKNKTLKADILSAFFILYHFNTLKYECGAQERRATNFHYTTLDVVLLIGNLYKNEYFKILFFSIDFLKEI